MRPSSCCKQNLKIRCHAIPACRFVVEHTMAGAPICDVSSIITEDMVAELTAHVATFLDSGLVTWLYDTLSHAENMSTFSTDSANRSLRYSTAYRMTLLNPLAPYSTGNHWISTDASCNTSIPCTAISVGYNSIKVRFLLAKISPDYTKYHNKFSPGNNI